MTRPMRSVAREGVSTRLEIAELKSRLAESEDILRAIRSGEVDAIAVKTSGGERVFTLEGAEQPYRVMVETMGEGALSVTPGGVILYCNRRFAEMVKTENHLIMGSSLLALFTNEESAKILTALAESRIGTSRVMASLLATDGTRVACSMAMQNQADGETQRIAIVVTDMTAWLRLEAASERSSRALRMVNACNKIVIRATDEVQMLAGICQTMVDEGGYELAWVGYAEHDEAKSVRPVARSQRYEHYVENARITWADNERGRGPTGTAIRAGRSIIAHDTEIDPQYGPWRRMAQEMGFRSSATFPLYANHDVIGALMVYSARPDGFDTDEEQLLTGLVGNIEFGIVALRNKNVRSRLATIVEAAGDAIIGRDLDGTVTAWNHAAERMLGYRAGEIIGRPMTALVPQVLTGESDWLFDKAMRGETIEQFDTIRLAKDGRQIPVSLTYSPIRGNAGEVVAVAVFMRDNTARKNAEEALRRIREQHEAAIRTSELRYRRRFETAADGIVVANARTHRVQDVNPAFVSMLGYSRDECLGRTLEEFGLLRAEAGEEVPLEEMGDTGDYYRRAALPIRAKDGQQIDVEFVAVIFQVGDEMTIQCNLRDITARRYFEQALQQKNRELEDANRAKDRFLANMSHEFRTPLTGIIGFTGTLLMRLPGDLTAAQEKQLRTVQSNAKQLLSLINDLLNLAKIRIRQDRTEPGRCGLQEDPAGCCRFAWATRGRQGTGVRRHRAPARRRRDHVAPGGLADHHQSHRQRGQVHHLRWDFARASQHRGGRWPKNGNRRQRHRHWHSRRGSRQAVSGILPDRESRQPA